MKNRIPTSALGALMLVASFPAASAAWDLPSIFASGMVLQREAEAPFWGWDEPGTTVTVAFRGQTRSAKAGPDGKWTLRIPTGKAGGPFTVAIQGTRDVKLEDVLVGEVWVAGGQSNMWWHQRFCKDAEKELQDADYPLIRYWDANSSEKQGGWRARSPRRTVAAVWQGASPRSVPDFAGVPFFFARELHRKLDVPVGIVQLAVPGAPIELFLSENSVERHRALLGDPAKAEPSAFYNGMVAPAAPFAARGFLWWQGEANAARSAEYKVLFPALIEDWRRAWARPEAPFLFVELANFLQLQTRPVEDDAWPALRDAQLSGLALDQVWEVSAIDVIGPDESPMNIHPPRKQLIAHRLCLAAMANVYDETDVIWSGPRFRSVRLERGRAIVAFDHAHGGLKAKGGQPLKGFAVAGADRRFVWAEARIEGDTVELVSSEVAEPVAVRYAWANNPVGNLYNGEDLPAFPFRTDDWELCVKAKKE